MPSVDDYILQLSAQRFALLAGGWDKITPL